jgi:hypothetical protein
MRYWRALRRWILTPGIRNTRLDVRGFPEKSPQARARLERVGATFLAGYGHAMAAARPRDAETQLEQVDAPVRGFAYEGAAMGFAMRDGLPLGRIDHMARFLEGRADQHIYMCYVGVGWAMARLPRFRWEALYAPDELLRWLVLDGYGFHQAYFRTGRYVYRQYRERNFPWPAAGPDGYADRVIDQGIGRAMWFVAGTDTARLTAMFAGFPESRRADLYSGAGLAATYAGGADVEELRQFRRDAGPYRRDLAQGSAFAAGARVRAGLVVPHNEVATEVFCGLSPEQAAAVTDKALPDGPGKENLPAYEVWRQRIAAEFADRD